MTLVSVEDAKATRRIWREDVQWNIARRDEAFRLADNITGETLGNNLARLYFVYSNAVGSGVDSRWSKYHKELCQLAEQNKGSLPVLRRLWKALDVLPKKPAHLTGWGNAGASFQQVISTFMRAVFAAEMGLQLTRHVQRKRGWPRKLIETPGVQGVDHDFTMVPHHARRGRVELYGWEPYWPPSDGGQGFKPLRTRWA
jgi:hypothetical protein